MRTKWLLALLLGSFGVACLSCASNETSGTAGGQSHNVPGKVRGGVYSRFNVHYYVRKGTNLPAMTPVPLVARRAVQTVCIASYANFTDCPGHSLLPYNTQFRVGSWRNGFRLVPVGSRLQIFVEYESGGMQGMSVQGYIRTITSPWPIDYEGLNAQDQEGIKTGKAMVGMTKQGVMVALGYPATSKTPSTDLNTWVYWKTRLNTLTVNFSPDGLVESVN
jgi:hypothetical protein